MKILLTLIVFLVSVSFVNAKDTYRHEMSVEGDIGAFKLGVEQQYFYDSNEQIEEATTIYTSFKLDNLTISPAYRQSMASKKGEWKREYRPRIDVTYALKHTPFTISNRLRYEYRDVEGETSNRIRNMIKVAYTSSIKDYIVIPYIATEVFYEIEDSEIERKRVRIGSTIVSKHFKNVSVDMYYMPEIVKNKENNTIVGVKTQYTF